MLVISLRIQMTTQDFYPWIGLAREFPVHWVKTTNMDILQTIKTTNNLDIHAQRVQALN